MFLPLYSNPSFLLVPLLSSNYIYLLSSPYVHIFPQYHIYLHILPQYYFYFLIHVILHILLQYYLHLPQLPPIPLLGVHGNRDSPEVGWLPHTQVIPSIILLFLISPSDTINTLWSTTLETPPPRR